MTDPKNTFPSPTHGTVRAYRGRRSLDGKCDGYDFIGIHFLWSERPHKMGVHWFFFLLLGAPINLGSDKRNRSKVYCWKGHLVGIFSAPLPGTGTSFVGRIRCPFPFQSSVNAVAGGEFEDFLWIGCWGCLCVLKGLTVSGSVFFFVCEMCFSSISVKGSVCRKL